MTSVAGPPGLQSASATPTTSGPTTASGTYATIAEMSVTITTRGGVVLVSYGVSLGNDQLAGITTIGLSVDAAAPAAGTELIAQDATVSNIIQASGVARVTGLSAASHTFAMQWKVSAGTTTGSTTRRYLVVQEVPS